MKKGADSMGEVMHIENNLRRPRPPPTREGVRHYCSSSRVLPESGASTGGKWTQLASSLAQGGFLSPPRRVRTRE